MASDDVRRLTGNEIAIIGMAGRFPRARNIDEFWTNLRNGVEATSKITAEDLRAIGEDPAILANPEYVSEVFAIDGADHFDAEFFGYSPREAQLMDPQQRLFLEVAAAALDHAGYDPDRYQGLIGVFGGVGRNSYYLRATAARPELVKLAGEHSAMIYNERDFPTTHVSYKLNLRGPSVDVQTACSTSGVALHLACQSLRSGDCDIALTGGCKVVYPNREGYWYVEGGPLAPEGHIRAFDADANGMVRGSGAAMLVLKRLEDALEDGDTVYAIVLGSAVNNDGSGKVGFTAPSVAGQADAIADAYAAAGISADSVSYIETHGTGTVLGDPIELSGLTEAFRRTTGRTGFCAIGSVKTNIGHLDAGATSAGLIKTVLALQHEQLPASLNFKRPNPGIDWPRTPFFVNHSLTDWPRTAAPRRAGVSSFGLGGTNAHIVLEEAPVAAPTEPGRRHELLVLSARTLSALDVATDELAAHLSRNPTLSLADVAHTLQVGRRNWAHRRTLVCADHQEAIAALTSRDPRTARTESLGEGEPTLVFMFPGGGAQYPGMASGLYRAEPEFQRAVDECLDLMAPQRRSIVRSFFEPRTPGTAADAAFEKPSVALPALFAVEYGLARLWSSWGITASALIGHSMGEYTAACLAGVFSLADALRLVTRRGELFETLAPGSMLSVAASEATLRSMLDDRLSIAALNRPGSCVVSGPTEAIDALAARLAQRDIESSRVHISVAAHSLMVEPILAEFRSVVESMRLSRPTMPFVSNVTGTWITDAEAVDPAYWVRHLRQTVRFADGIATLCEDPRRVFLEVGPGQSLHAFARSHPGRRAEQAVMASTRHPQDDADDVRFALETLGRLWQAGLDVDWSGFRGSERRRRVGLPTYPFERKKYSLLTDAEFAAGLPSSESRIPVSAAAALPVAAAIVPATPSVPLPSTPMPAVSAAPQAAAAPRRDRLATEILSTLQTLSGMSGTSINPDATFLELGFDSLFLAQANSAFKKLFKVKLTTRQLLEKTPTVNALAAHLDKELAPDAFAPAPAPVSAPVSVAEPAAASSVPAALAAASGSALENVIVQQLQLMQAQLAALRGASGPGVSAAPAIAAAVTAAPAAGATAKSGMPDKSSPWQPVDKGATDGELTPAQHAHLSALMTRVQELTPKSKALTQQHRARLSDPRTVQGFKKQWKEMVYPIVSERAKGSKIWDIDGNEYIDLVCGYGVNFFGHGPDFIIDAARAQLDKTLAIGPQTPLAGEVATLVCELTGMERAAFCNTGSEAVLAAIRTARTVTGKSKIATFAGHYHGIFDEVLVKGSGAGAERRAVPVAPGIPQSAQDQVVVMEYNNPASFDVIRKHADEIALVLVEPVRSRNLDLQPKEFLQALRALTAELGIPLLFDEMITGFRSHPGGAQATFGVKADLVTYGKVIGGGFPIGIVAGKKEYLDALDGGMWSFGDQSTPEADMTWFAGTFVRHPLALAAAKASLEYLRAQGPQLQERLNERTRQFVDELNAHFRSTNAPIHIERFASAFLVTFPQFQEYSALLFYHLRNRGIYTYETRPAYFTLAHSDADIARVTEAFKESAAELQNVGLLSGGPVRRPGEPYTIPLSEGQQEIWLATRFGDDATRAFNLGSTMRLRGALNVDALRRALGHVVRRHEALRAVPNLDGRTQRVLPSLEIEMPIFDISTLTDDARQHEMLRLRDVEVQTAFDLANGPLVRARLIVLAPDDHLLVVTGHHIVCDGWSCGVVMRDLGALYEAECAGHPAHLPAPMQLSEWVDVSAAEAVSEHRAESEQYWMNEFAQSTPTLELPTDRPRPAVKTFRAKRIWQPVDQAFVRRVKQLAASQNATMFATLLAGFGAFLNRITRQDDIVVGFSLAGQSAITDRDLVGHCVKFLPLHLYPRGDVPFSEFVGIVRGKVLDAVEYQSLAFGALIQKLKLRRDPSRVPLMSVAFNLDPSGRTPRFGDLQAETGSVPRQFENFDIFFNLVEQGDDRLEIQCTFNLDLFDEATMWRFIRQYVVLVDGAAAAPATAIGALPILTDDDRRVMSGERRRVATPDSLSLTTVFAQQVARAPDAIAATCDGKSLTYGELDARSSRLAHHLRALGVGPETLVGLLIERSLDLVVATLGILKAGGAYVPVDATNPADRVAAIFGDAGVTLVVTQAVLADRIPSGVTAVRMDADRPAIDARPASAPAAGTTGDMAAYVIYTSGSTGTPKGVVVTHRNVLRLFESTQHWFQFGAGDVWTLFHSVAFDFSVWELWGALLHGGRLVVVPQAASRSPEVFLDLLSAERVTVLNQTPSAFRMLTQADALVRPTRALSLRYVIFGGEALNLESLRDWIERRGDAAPRLINMYGITETTVHVTYRPIRRSDLDARVGSVIGEPIPDLTVHLLDDHLQPVPIGVPGEIYVGGAGVARGYLKRPELDAQRFVADRFSSIPGARLYRSGDQARWLPDGDLEYLGRLDQQVKIRGFRIELGEIESVIRQAVPVADAAVIARDAGSGDRMLVAYVVPRSSTTDERRALPATLRERLRQRLPDYMVPAAVVVLDRLPMTANGKLNIAALPSHMERVAAAEDAPPTDLERRIAAVWATHLGVERVGPSENFFELGGHSLMGVQLIMQLREQLNVELSLGTLFEAPTVAQLARRIEALQYLQANTNAGDREVIEL